MKKNNNTWVELDLEALAGNITSLRSSLSEKTDIIFMVKANAYGHGLEPVAKCAWSNGIRWFDVADVREAAAARRLLPNAHILVSGAVSPDEVEDVLDLDLVPIIVSERHAISLADRAGKRGKTIRCHAMIDTGMGRLGFDWQSAPESISRLRKQKWLDIEGVCSHMASADGEERAYSDRQAALFLQTLDCCKKLGCDFRIRHISNSAGAMLDPSWDMDAVRVGIHLYGYPQLPAERRGAGRKSVRSSPILQWKTRIMQIRDVPAGFSVSYGSTYVTKAPTTIAIIAVGYSDGYMRSLGNRAEVLAGGRRCKVIGRVTMNSTIIDLGLDSKANEGDEAVLIGVQSNDSIWADELARLAGTISYEILTCIKPDAVFVVKGG